jgi:hypothetical protein
LVVLDRNFLQGRAFAIPTLGEDIMRKSGLTISSLSAEVGIALECRLRLRRLRA